MNPRFFKEQPKKMPEQNIRPGMVRRYCLIKSKSAAAPIIAKETEPSKLTTKSALTDNSLNTIRSRSSRVVSRARTTNLLITQGFFPHLPVWVESRVFLPSRNLEVFISRGAYASERSNSNKEIAGNSTCLLKRKMPEQDIRPGNSSICFKQSRKSLEDRLMQPVCSFIPRCDSIRFQLFKEAPCLVTWHSTHIWTFYAKEIVAFKKSNNCSMFKEQI